MFYAKLTADGSLSQYPYTLADLRLANPGTSFASKITDDVAAGFGVVPVTPTPQPAENYRINLNRTARKTEDGWIEQWDSTPATPQQITERTQAKANDVRDQRNSLLAQCDWTQLGDSPLTPEQKANWQKYRDDLRAIPQQAGFPWEVVWPSLPG